MMSLPKNIRLLWAALITGFTGATARAVLYRIGFDEKGLLSASHPLQILCWLIFIGLAVYLAAAVQKLAGSEDYDRNLPINPVRFLCFLSACTFLTIHAFSLLAQTGSMLDTVRIVLAFLSAICVMICWYLIAHGKRPHFLLHGLICVYFATEMVCRYRVWSGNPQLPDYCFHLLAVVFMTLSAYHSTALAAGLGRRRVHIFCGLMALCLGLFCLMGPEPYEFYLGGALWSAGCMCTLDPPEEI